MSDEDQDITSGKEFNVGDEVHVKSYGRAVVVQLQYSGLSNGIYHHRIQVQYSDGKTYWAQPSYLRKVVKVREMTSYIFKI
jgi:uncharacterized protein YodC (DUF2158 family)